MHLSLGRRCESGHSRDFDIEIVLYGDEVKINENYLTATERVSIVHTEKSIQMMSQRGPFVGRNELTMVLAARMDGEVDAMLSAGIQVPYWRGFLYRWPHQGRGTPGLM